MVRTVAEWPYKSTGLRTPKQNYNTIKQRNHSRRTSKSEPMENDHNPHCSAQRNCSLYLSDQLPPLVHADVESCLCSFDPHATSKRVCLYDQFGWGNKGVLLWTRAYALLVIGCCLKTWLSWFSFYFYKRKFYISHTHTHKTCGDHSWGFTQT